MKITITGSLGNTSLPLIKKLVGKGHNVKVISSNPARAKAIENLDAIPVIGSVDDSDFILKSFKDTDAVYTMVPPDFKVSDYTAFSEKVCSNYAKAIETNGVKHVVNLSSIGSALAGRPPLTAYYNLESRLNEIVALNVVHLRPCMFYTNFYGSMGLIKHQGIMGHNVDDNVPMLMTHPEDIAEVAFALLDSLVFKGIDVQYVVSDSKSGQEVAAILGAAIHQPALKWMSFSDEQLLAGLLQNGFSRHAAQHYIVDMGIAIRQGLLNEHYKHIQGEVFGKLRFDYFAQEFARAYEHS